MISLERVSAVAGNTVREAVRNKVLYALLFFALVMIGSGMLLATLSYVERDRILQDIGLGTLRIFGAAISIFLGVGLIYKEVDRRTIYTILSKPVTRTEFLLGKYVGLVATVWLQVLVMAVCFAAVSLLAGASLGLGHLAAVALAAVELAVLVAVATLFSSFSTPLLASFFTTGIYAIGHLTRDLRNLGQAGGSEGLALATRWLHRLLPDLESFNLTLQAVHDLPISSAEVLFPIVYGLGYASLLLALASWVFARRDFR